MTDQKQEWTRKAREAVIALDKTVALEVAEQASAALGGSDLLDLMEGGFRAGIAAVGDMFGRKEMFLPELVVAADILKRSFEIVEARLHERDLAARPAGKVVLATVKGDLHDIGKTMVSSLLTANGFKVIDLGVDVEAEEIIDTAVKDRADIIALSALLTTTIDGQKEVIDALAEAGLRDRFKVLIGGAASSIAWAKVIGADAYGADAQEAAALALNLLKK